MAGISRFPRIRLWKYQNQGKDMRISVSGTVIAFLLFMSTIDAQAAATCFCKISTDNIEGATSATGTVIDLTGDPILPSPFTGLFQQSESRQQFCQASCSIAAQAVGKPTAMNAACAAHASSTTVIAIGVRAYSAVGTRTYRVAETFGEAYFHPAIKQTICSCPSGWLSNTSNLPAGVTGDGRCKKLSGTYTGPLFQNGTPIGAGGEAFTWGNEIWVYGTAANSGKANCATSVLQASSCTW